MFEMFPLLINLLILTLFWPNGYLLLVFFYLHVWRITPRHFLHYIYEILPWEFAAGICRGYLPQEFAVEIWHRNLPWLFAVGICCGNLPWVFCICKQIFFCVCEQILFIWKQTFFICEQNFFLCEIFFISFRYCRGSYEPP